MKKVISDIVKQPFVHFLLLGAVFYLLYTWIGGPAIREPDNVIRVTVADVSRLDAAWRARWNRPPTEEEIAGLVRAYVREIALYRHAVAMGLDRNDAAVRRMLGQKLQSLTQNLVELSLSPTDQELQTYFAVNKERYQPPALITFTQLFLDPDQRGEKTLEDAEEILAILRALPEPTDGIDEIGDPFMLQRYYPGKTKMYISRQFGQDFAQSVFELAPGEWHGPVLSGYGVHLVYVDHMEESPLPEFAPVRVLVKQDWMDEKRREFQDVYIEEVLARYEVVFDESPPATPDTSSASGQEATE